ncbi:MAG: hypothetical protein LE168_03420 [Endomicrobium sp.]|nr:hypothetical protein [Endomicrobium sp.]
MKKHIAVLLSLSIILSSCSKGNDVARVEPVADEDIKTESVEQDIESSVAESMKDENTSHHEIPKKFCENHPYVCTTIESVISIAPRYFFNRLYN